jgi:predicted phosphodiesterase
VIAALYDIHANLPGLEAVLDEISQLAVDQVIIGGDVVPGPMPRETLARLDELEVPVQFLYGNGEVAVLDQLGGRDLAKVPEQYRPAIVWTAEQLDSTHHLMIASWPLTLRIEVSGLGEVLFCHATPRNENDTFTRLSPEDRVLPLFEPAGAATVVCGHTHMQFERMIGKTRVVNAGSVGMPFGSPGADWLLLGSGIQFRHTEYDFAEAAALVRRTGYPDAENFAAKSILQPPSEAEMLQLFARVELK